LADAKDLSLLAFKKGDDTPVATGEKGTGLVDITGLKPGTVVNDGDYQVANSDGTTLSGKVDVPGWTVALPAVPTAPTISATAIDGGFDYTITPDANVASENVDKYTVHYTAEGGKEQTQDVPYVAGNVTGSISGLTDGTAVNVAVTAHNAGGDSTESAVVAVTPVAAQPTAPEDVTPKPTDDGAKVSAN